MAGCKEMIVQKETEYQWLIRCQKPDHIRGEFWDNYIFRFSPSVAVYEPNDLPVVDKHTICIDNDIRIEAFPPD